MTSTYTTRIACLAIAALFAASACSSAASSPSSASRTEAPGASSGASGGGSGPLPPTGDVTLNGAGATFPQLLYQVWTDSFSTRFPSVQINYQGIGSGGGIKAITQRTVDFGASDAAMKDSEIAALPPGTTLLHVPTALGAVVVIVNVKGKDGKAISGLKLDADTVANLFLGKIKKWSDPAIAATNADIASNLPDTAVLVVHRSDGSGTTNAFTSYLDTVNADWHASVGAGKDVKWPTGAGAPGNDGVSAGVKQNDGAVGYVELQYAVVSGLQTAALRNAAGKFVQGSSAGVTAAAESAVATFPADFRQAPIINAPGDATYPIASYTYLLVYQDQKDATKGRALVAFLYWALTDGQKEEKALGYAPLPEPIRSKALDALTQITTGGAPIWK